MRDAHKIDFKVGGALDIDSPVYIERQADYEAIKYLHKMDYLKIIEPRQQGKTSLIIHLMGKLKGHLFCYIDMTTLNMENEVTWYKSLCDRILRKLNFISQEVYPEYPTSASEWYQFLSIISEQVRIRNKNFVIALDEIGLAKLDWPEYFFSNIRAIYNERSFEPAFKHVAFIFAGAFNPQDLISDKKISPFNIASRISLPDFTFEQISQLVNHLNIAEDQVETITSQIHYWTDGQPYLTQFICDYLSRLENPLVSAKDVDNAVTALICKDTNHLPGIMRFLEVNNELRNYIAKICQGDKIRFSSSSRRHCELEINGVIKADNAGFCKIRNRICEEGFLPFFKNPNRVNFNTNPNKEEETMFMYFNWLHLTDLHRGMDEQDWLWPTIRHIFFEDLKKLHATCGPWDLVLFTGDLSQKGTSKEFQKVNQILKELWAHLETLGSSPALLVVPGNHDLVRPDSTDPRVTLLKDWANQKSVRDDFWKISESQYYYQMVEEAFANYSKWWKKQKSRGKPIKNGILPGDFVFTFEKKGAKLGIVGLNSTFLQLTGDDYKGKLALSGRQFQSVCNGDGPKWVKEHHACLLLTHHPPSWLNEQSFKELNSEITTQGHFVVHLCGHLHEAAASYSSVSGSKIRRIWQGRSVFGLESFGEEQEDRQHGYTAGRIELHENQGKLMFWPRKAHLQRGGEWNIIPDPDITLENEHTKPEMFDLHQPYTIQSNSSTSESPPDAPSGDREHISLVQKPDRVSNSSQTSREIIPIENSPLTGNANITKESVLIILHQVYRQEGPDEWVSSKQIQEKLNIPQEQLNDFIFSLREKGFIESKHIGSERALLKITTDGVTILK